METERARDRRGEGGWIREGDTERKRKELLFFFLRMLKTFLSNTHRQKTENSVATTIVLAGEKQLCLNLHCDQITTPLNDITSKHQYHTACSKCD